MVELDLNGIVVPAGPCPYLPGREHASFLPVPMRAAMAGYRPLLDAGFRRSGPILYRPTCEGCDACRPIRVDVAAFRPRREQVRCARRNADLVAAWEERGMDDERFALLDRYQRAIHHDPFERDQARQFLVEAGGVPGGEVHLRDAGGRLVGVSIVDRFDDALSSVYAYFDPELRRRSLGTALVLEELRLAAGWGLAWHYLGFHVAACSKMSYKGRFHPHEILVDDAWVRYDQPGGALGETG